MKARLAWNGEASRWMVDPRETDLDKGKVYEVEVTEKVPERIDWVAVSRKLFKKYSNHTISTGMGGFEDLMDIIKFQSALNEAREIDRDRVRQRIAECAIGRSCPTVPMDRVDGILAANQTTYPSDCVKETR